MLDRVLVILAVAAMQLKDTFEPLSAMRWICWVCFYVCVYVLIERVKEGK